MNLPIEFNRHGLKTQLMGFVGAQANFDWDALTSEVIMELEYMHESGEPMTYEFSPLWSADGKPQTFTPTDDVWSLKRWEIWCYHLPEEERRRGDDFMEMFQGCFARFEEALAEATALHIRSYYEISIKELSEDGLTKNWWEQEEWMEVTA